VRQTPFDGFFGTKFDILKPRRLPTLRIELRAALHTAVEHGEDSRSRPILMELLAQMR
jgi:hypothetical protein